MRRHDNKTTYKITTARALYAVTLDRAKNDINGNPRYNANILVLDVFGENMSGDTIYTANYTFKGSYLGDREEARKVVDYYESNL